METITRKAIVTAASDGIGFGAAEYLLKNKHQVGITARNESRLNNLAAKYQDLVTHPTDHSLVGQTSQSITQLIEKLGGLDTLVLNTPHPIKGSFEQLTLSDWNSSIQTLFMMNIEAIEAALPSLKKSESGRIIFILSTAAKEPIQNLVISSSLRAGLLGLMKSLSRELAQFGITVNAVLPGYTQTTGLNQVIKTQDQKTKLLEQIPLRKLALVCDHGAIINFLSEARNNYITGQVISVDGGLIQGI